MFAALPPSSSVSLLPVPASSRWIALPTSVEPVNAILSTPWCLTSAAPVRPSPVTMFTTPGGSSAWRQTSQKSSAVSGVVSAGFSTTVFPAASAGAIFHASIEQREVPRNDLARDAERLGLAVREGVLELVGPARVVEEVRGREREVDVAGLVDRLAAVQGLEHRELARALLDDAGDPVEVLRALGGRELRPAVVEGRRAPPRRRGPRPAAFACATSASVSSLDGRSIVVALDHSPPTSRSGSTTHSPPMKRPYALARAGRSRDASGAGA